MNAEDTKKAMKCCMKTFPLCQGCPLKGTCITGQRKPLKKALDLIEHYEAEIERLKKENNWFADIGKMYSEIKSETIKEFAESIKAEIREALESNYKAKSEIMAKPNVDMADEFISYCEGKIAALRGIDDFVDTLISGETKTADSDFPKDYSYGY